MDFEIDQTTYDQIATVINSDKSPVGIDAKKTHVLILKALTDLTSKIDHLEREIVALKEHSQSLNQKD